MNRSRLAVSASAAGGSRSTAGALAASAWLRDRAATPPAHSRWHVEIALDVVNRRAPTEFDETSATRFHINIYAEEWGTFFCHGGRSSWIRVTDVPFVHGKDDFNLISLMPALEDVGQLLRRVEQANGIRFQREYAAIDTNLPNLEAAVLAWIATL